MIKVNGGRPWGKIEKLLKDAAVMAFKDAGTVNSFAQISSDS